MCSIQLDVASEMLFKMGCGTLYKISSAFFRMALTSSSSCSTVRTQCPCAWLNIRVILAQNKGFSITITTIHSHWNFLIFFLCVVLIKMLIKWKMQTDQTEHRGTADFFPMDDPPFPLLLYCWGCIVLHQPPLSPSPTVTTVHMLSQKECPQAHRTGALLSSSQCTAKISLAESGIFLR